MDSSVLPLFYFLYHLLPVSIAFLFLPFLFHPLGHRSPPPLRTSRSSYTIQVVQASVTSATLLPAASAPKSRFDRPSVPQHRSRGHDIYVPDDINRQRERPSELTSVQINAENNAKRPRSNDFAEDVPTRVAPRREFQASSLSERPDSTSSITDEMQAAEQSRTYFKTLDSSVSPTDVV